MKRTFTALAICIVVIVIILPEILNLFYVLYRNPLQKNVTYRTGDLLLFRCHDTSIIKKSKKLFKLDFSNFFNIDYYQNNFLKLYIKKYIHMGFIVVLNNRPYIYDISYNTYSKKKYDNYTNKYVINTPALIDISYLNYYCGDVFKASYKGPKIDTNKLFLIFKKYQNSTISTNEFIMRCMRKKLGLKYDKNKSIICTELIANVLNSLNIIDINSHPCITSNSILDACLKSGKYLPEKLIRKKIY